LGIVVIGWEGLRGATGLMTRSPISVLHNASSYYWFVSAASRRGV